MARTIGSILTIAGTAALVATGVGAVAGLAAFGTLSGVSLGGVGLSSLLLASTALTGIGGQLSAPKAPKAETTAQALKTERPPRFSAYGRLKMFGAYILYETASNGYAVDAWAFHDGRIDGIEGWYLGDKKVTRLENGFVQKGEDGAYGNSDTIQIGANLGAATETAHAALISALPGIWTSDHRGDGVVTGYMISKAVKAKNYQEIYPAGGPNQTPLAIVIRAQPVFDWRDPSQSVSDPLTWKWSENAVLHLAHYQLVRNNKTWTRHFLPTLNYWTAAANDADVAVPLKAGGTEPRYRSCVSHRHAGDGSEHKAVIGAIVACFDGWMCPREDGALVVYSGRYYQPTVAIGPDQVIGYTIEEGVEDENAVNQIGVTYVSDKHDFNTVDTDPWTDEDDILARGAVRADDLANQVPSYAQARRLAKRKMIQAMAGKRGSVTLLPSASAVLSERFIHLTLAELIGSDDEFVPLDAAVEITGLTRNLQTGVIQASWILADPNIDSWIPALEEGNPAPVGESVPRQELVTPIITTATVQFTADAGAGAPGAFIRLAVSAPNRSDLQWSARTRVVGAAIWGQRDYTDLDASASVIIDTEFVPTDAMVEVQVLYQVGDGRSSDWSPSKVVDTSTAALDVDYDGGNAAGNPS